MTLEMRVADRSDAEFIVESQMRMAMETEGLRLDLPTLKLGVSAVIEDATKGQYYVALRDGMRISCFLTMPEWSDWRNGTVLWIHSAYVIPEERRKGVFREMYRQLKEQVEQRKDLRGLRLYVEKTNYNAKKTYQSLGMSNEHYELYEWLK